MKILYEDKDICVAEKPAGVLAQSSRGFDLDMVSELKTYLKKDKEEPYVAVINRLDRPVSGIMLFAKNKAAAAALTKQLNDHNMNKQYYAVVCGKPDKEKDTFVDYLLKDAKNNISKVVKEGSKDAKRAELSYETVKDLSSGDKVLTLVKIKLETGRHHQIRVQFSHHGLPLLNDVKYNPAYKTERSGGNVALCAYKLEFKHPVSKKDMSFEIEPSFLS